MPDLVSTLYMELTVCKFIQICSIKCPKKNPIKFKR